MEQDLPQHAETNDDKESNSFANCPLCEHSCIPLMLRQHLIGAHIEELKLEEINMISEEAINCNWGTNTRNEASATITSVGFDNINDQMFNMESVLDDASLDSIKSDSVWSSVNLFPSLMDSHVNSSNTANSRKRRHRDVSLTLSECAEGLLSTNQLDVGNMLEKFSYDPDPTLGASPTFLSTSFGASMMRGHENQNSNDSSNDIESETETDEDDEIDVVGTNSDLGGSSARTRHCNLAINRANKNQKHHLKQQNNDQSR